MTRLWRSIVLLMTLLLIYLLFPILLVPSSLPAIQEMAIGQAGVPIYQLEIEPVPTLGDKIKVLQQLHRQGLAIILQQTLGTDH